MENMTSSQNWKYITYCIIIWWRTSHGHR